MPVERGVPEACATPGLFIAHVDLTRVRSLREVRDHVEAGDAQIVDARSPGRFAGAEPEPRPGVEPGHIPGALNLPYSRLFGDDGRWKSLTPSPPNLPPPASIRPSRWSPPAARASRRASWPSGRSGSAG
ncbi:rhodanese-like domain-containing protein [Sphingomonas sp. I4]